jgi:hypothetical protein
MSPTVFRSGGFRFYFFSREETRPHVHVHSARGEAKFWMDPEIKLAQNYRLTQRELKSIEKLIEEHENEIRKAWQKHYGS